MSDNDRVQQILEYLATHDLLEAPAEEEDFSTLCLESSKTAGSFNAKFSKTSELQLKVLFRTRKGKVGPEEPDAAALDFYRVELKIQGNKMQAMASTPWSNNAKETDDLALAAKHYVQSLEQMPTSKEFYNTLTEMGFRCP